MFDATNHLLYDKGDKDLDPYILEEFNPWFISKVFSFYDSGKYCGYVNDTLNTYSGIFKDKEDQFRFFENVIPKLKKRKWEYIKKEKSEKKKEDEVHLPEFLSKREVDYFQNTFK